MKNKPRYVSRVFGLVEANWRAIAEMWAGTDVDIFRDVAICGIDVKAAIRAEVEP